MIADPQRLQYLEAMGIPAWVSRYRFSNARPTEQGEWVEPARGEKPAPGERLHALLDRPEPNEETRRRPEVNPTGDASSAPAETADPAPQGERTSRARALLEAETGIAESRTPAPTAAAAPAPVAETAAEAASPAEPLRFSLNLAVLGGRWWLLMPGERALSKPGEALLQQMLSAAGLPARWQALANLRWPLMSTPTPDPEGEAREGIEVFCAGQARRNELTIDGAIVVGNEAWASLVDTQSTTLAVHRWPHPDDLLGDVRAKRESWSRLCATGDGWRAASVSADTPS
ncbi:hypothetical protein [Salinicola aestuarinus]|uniref:hypothetical protein n=1 Tax=Salinicola aestuarinus TaxID=1949082 RepID=UPI000DA13FE5|nr:hypothetical protein [Salinicola aestuarinus]